eukprot:gene18780-24547_t
MINNKPIITTDTSINKQIVDSFVPRRFHPTIGFFGLLSNPHWQTIVGSEALRIKLFGDYPRNFNTISERINTPDNDFFDVEFTDNIPNSKGIVILCHGLESNLKSALITKMAIAYQALGFSCALTSYRGCNGEDNLSLGSYHLGFTNDLKYFVTIVHDRYPNIPIYLSGFSLGGNVILKYLGELGDFAKDFNIAGAVCTCIPFDPVASQNKLATGFNRAVYAENFLSSLKAKAERMHIRYPNSFDIEEVRKCRTIGDFDDKFIAKVFGFKDKIDYYLKTGSKWWLNKIRIPSIVINARDDPFIDEDSLPTDEDIGIAPVRLIYHEEGGHCGFIANRKSYEDFTFDSNKTELDILKAKEKIASDNNINCGWLAEEMGRALLTIHESKVDLNIIV